MTRIEHGGLPLQGRCHGASGRTVRFCSTPRCVACGEARKSAARQEG